MPKVQSEIRYESFSRTVVNRLSRLAYKEVNHFGAERFDMVRGSNAANDIARRRETARYAGFAAADHAVILSAHTWAPDANLGARLSGGFVSARCSKLWCCRRHAGEVKATIVNAKALERRLR
jgi:hypothetical protein